MFTLLLLICISSLVAGDDCEPGFADSCFGAVISDLKYMLNLRKMQAVNVTSYAVSELCLALDDALNCTSDIIDTDCTEQDGRYVFDSWLMAFRSAYHYVCDGTNHKGIKDILQGTPCWSIEDFVLCIQEKAKLPDVRHILHVPMDKTECEDLHRVIKSCRDDATVGSCREQEYVFRAVNGMSQAFLDGSDCKAFLPDTGLLPSAGDRTAKEFFFHFFSSILGICILLVPLALL